MPVPFGVGVGDVIAVFELVHHIVRALRESGGSSIRCHRVINQLLALETALNQVKQLKHDEQQRDQIIALTQTAASCRTTLDEFEALIQKYSSHLSSTSVSSVFTQVWSKVKWALIPEKDLTKSLAGICVHTEAINLILNTIQLRNLAISEEQYETRHSSILQALHQYFTKSYAKLKQIIDLGTSNATCMNILVQKTMVMGTLILHTYESVLRIEQTTQSLPQQILRNAPICLIDARGLYCPFYTEFIQSREAFVAVLMENFRGCGSARRMIGNYQFVISETSRNRDIDLDLPWHVCFRPGQQVEMAMLFTEEWQDTSCPSCQTPCAGGQEQDITCTVCNLSFRRIIEVEEEPMNPSRLNTETHEDWQNSLSDPSPSLVPRIASLKRCRDEPAFEDEIKLYKKVRLRSTGMKRHEIADDEDFKTAKLKILIGRDLPESMFELDPHEPRLRPYLCTFEGCERANKDNGFPRRWNQRDHMRRVHGWIDPRNVTSDHRKIISEWRANKVLAKKAERTSWDKAIDVILSEVFENSKRLPS